MASHFYFLKPEFPWSNNMEYTPVRWTFLALMSGLDGFIQSTNSFNKYYRNWAKSWDYSSQIQGLCIGRAYHKQGRLTMDRQLK